MNAEARDFWQRAAQALDTASQLQTTDPDASASRAYYSAFYSVSAWFALAGRTFTKHSAVESAVHRDLVKSGLWPADLGAQYSFLRGLRETGDYGGGTHVTPDGARDAVSAARAIISALKTMSDNAFS